MTPYEGGWLSPPGPVARVQVRNRETGRALSEVLLLIDSGADVTLIPRHAVEALGLEPLPGEELALVGFDGSTSTARVVRLELVFCNRLFRGRFLIIDQETGILGRNVLNALPLILDGPRLQWSVTQPESASGTHNP